MGFYTKQWSTLLKGPIMTGLKERFELRRIEKKGGKVSELFLKKFPKIIEEDHAITYFYKKKFPSFLKAIRVVCTNCVNIIFNQLTQDISEIKAEGGIIKQLADFWMNLPKDKDQKFKEIERTALIRLAAIDDEETKLRYRPEYKEVEAITLEAKKSGDHQEFMDFLRTRVKKNLKLRNLLEKRTWRWEINTSTRCIISTNKLRNDLKNLLKRISKETKNSNLTKLSKELEIELNQICETIKIYFRESYLVRERAILMILKVLYTVEKADEYLKKMVKGGKLPEVQTESAINSLKKMIDKEVGKNFNELLSQEFRIVINKLELEELQAERSAKSA